MKKSDAFSNIVRSQLTGKDVEKRPQIKEPDSSQAPKSETSGELKRKSPAGAKRKKSVLTLQTIAWYRHLSAIAASSIEKPLSASKDRKRLLAHETLNKIVDERISTLATSSSTFKKFYYGKKAAEILKEDGLLMLNPDYRTGKTTPSEEKLNIINRCFPGTKAIFERGPFSRSYDLQSIFPSLWVILSSSIESCVVEAGKYHPYKNLDLPYELIASASPAVKIKFLLFCALGLDLDPKDLSEIAYLRSGNAVEHRLQDSKVRHDIRLEDVYVIMAIHRISIQHLDRTTWWGTAVMLEALNKAGVVSDLLRPWGLESLLPAYFQVLCSKLVKSNKFFFINPHLKWRCALMKLYSVEMGVEPLEDQRRILDPHPVPFYSSKFNWFEK